MEWSGSVYAGQGIRDINGILASLKVGRPVFQLYCVCFVGEKPQVQILSSRALFSIHNQKRRIRVIGLAKGYEEAISVLCHIVTDVAQAGHNLSHPKEWGVL